MPFAVKNASVSDRLQAGSSVTTTPPGRDTGTPPTDTRIPVDSPSDGSVVSVCTLRCSWSDAPEPLAAPVPGVPVPGGSSTSTGTRRSPSRQNLGTFWSGPLCGWGPPWLTPPVSIGEAGAFGIRPLVPVRPELAGTGATGGVWWSPWDDRDSGMPIAGTAVIRRTTAKRDTVTMGSTYFATRIFTVSAPALPFSPPHP